MNSWMLRPLACAVLLLAACIAARGSITGAQTAPAPALPGNAARWSWLANTYWFVPNRNLPAMIYLAAERRQVPISDQTVYHITSYRDGYFVGDTVVQLGQAAPTCMSLVGSVTPEGRVLLTFTPLEPTEDATVTQGVGEMRFESGQWTMENQMTSGPGASALVAHWAYMFQTRPGDRSWAQLPGVRISVPDFMAQCGIKVGVR